MSSFLLFYSGLIDPGIMLKGHPNDIKNSSVKSEDDSQKIGKLEQVLLRNKKTKIIQKNIEEEEINTNKIENKDNNEEEEGNNLNNEIKDNTDPNEKIIREILNFKLNNETNNKNKKKIK